MEIIVIGTLPKWPPFSVTLCCMTDILKLLTAERDRLNRAIAALQGDAPRRGRPPGSGKKAAKAKPAAPAKRNLSPEARKRQSERMKAYWAARRKAKKKADK